MAKKRGIQNTSKTETRSFQKGMVKDLNETLMGEGSYLNAINAVNNSRAGDLGVIGNEQSNQFCTQAPYTIIGTIHLYDDKWAIFSTDNVDSEVGLFDESDCSYTTVANDPCLGFQKTNLIIGEAKENFDCTWQVYWADGLNPDRTMNMDNPPWIQDCNPDPQNPDCIICNDTTDLDCDKLRMARLTTIPCIKMAQGPGGGELLNGTYQAVIAYTENEQRVSDYSIPSNPVSLFDHRNVNGSLEITIESIDTTYDEFELVVIGAVNQQTVAVRVGIYSTRQKRISLDKLEQTLPSVPLRFIPLDRPAYEKSEGIYRNGEYLLRVAPTSRFSFNYQPLANQIQTEWVSVEYPPDYYAKAGVNVGYLRDEVYTFFIRWIYDTNDKSESYHIPGRPPTIYTPLGLLETDTVPSPAYTTGFVFEEYNTATAIAATGTTSDGGTVVARGQMGYWESSEIYPDDKPEIWADLCGKNIRHHKMPDNELENHFNQGNKNIRVLGVQFSNIPFPEDNDGNPIPGIVGYEILRGTREGNKTVVAKGLLNNMGSYERPDTGDTVHYQNYPYNDLNRDPLLANNWIGDNIADRAAFPFEQLGGPRYARDKFTFHSPETQFKHPFLSSKELKVYETLWGTPTGLFADPYQHPKHKILTDQGFLLGNLIGFGIAALAVIGEQKSSVQIPSQNDSTWSVTGYTIGGNVTSQTISGTALSLAEIPVSVAEGLESGFGFDYFGQILAGQQGDGSILGSAYIGLSEAMNGTQGITTAETREWNTNGGTGLHPILRVVQSIPTFLAYWGEGTDNFLSLIKSFSKWRQYATAYQSHCFHDRKDFTSSNFRTAITDASYIDDGLMEFGGVTVNNLFRSGCVGITTDPSRPVPDPVPEDTSRFKMSDAGPGLGALPVNEANFDVEFEIPNRPASAHYVGLKQRLRNQYGQVDGIIQVPTSSCMQEYVIDPTSPGGATSEIIFGGDTYIGRYTEKNTFFFFTDWMQDLPDGFEFDYRLHKMQPYPTYWMDTKNFQLNDFFSGIISLMTSVSGSPTAMLPSGFHNFDSNNIFGVPIGAVGLTFNGFASPLIETNKVMYLFYSGVRDFYVESEVNIEYRDWDDEVERRHYDPNLYEDIKQMFRTDRIKVGNFYKYDYTLSVSRFYQNFGSWATMQRRNYDPEVAETCYTYYPNRVIYSLPQNKELIYDNWLSYLVNNYKDFTSRVTAIKPIGKNGAMILFENEAPVQVPGVDVLQTDAGTKITIGDGGLFSQPLQNLVNVETPYEYGSCQNRLSVINTPAGLFWISRNQGKIFQFTGQMEDIAQKGMKWWFEEFLPYKILDDFPTFDLIDNPVIGVGCQAIYNNSDGIVYFSKKDYRLRREFQGQVTYLGDNEFRIRNARFFLGDERYFEDASWTASYDPKVQAWISFHDWHPNLMLPGKNQHMTILNRGIWKHNDRSDSYCNFYGQDYPFEVELVTPTGQSVNTLKSIEYLMEVYQWDQEEVDRYHVLDFNFDRAVVYNTEQVSGELRLNITPKNNAPAINNYPIVNASSIDILYSKEEQKYRFNQFWDITDDRGEFTTAARQIWVTEPNGYIRILNPVNLNYQKPLHQRKKFRHYQSNLRLTRRISGPNNMQLKLVNSKNQYSMR